MQWNDDDENELLSLIVPSMFTKAAKPKNEQIVEQLNLQEVKPEALTLALATNNFIMVQNNNSETHFRKGESEMNLRN